MSVLIVGERYNLLFIRFAVVLSQQCERTRIIFVGTQIRFQLSHTLGVCIENKNQTTSGVRGYNQFPICKNSLFRSETEVGAHVETGNMGPNDGCQANNAQTQLVIYLVGMESLHVTRHLFPRHQYKQMAQIPLV